MGFVSYRATRKIQLGQIRRDLQPGDVVDFDGRTTRIAGKEYRVDTMSDIIEKGWLVSVDPAEAALVVGGTHLPAVVATDVATDKVPRKPQAANHVTPAREDQERDLRGEKIGYASPEARAASGKRPSPSQQHVWNTGGPSPDWLNSLDGGRTCKVCGVTERADIIRADRQRGDGSQQIHYVDAHGNSIVSFEELGCPTYLGDPGSAAAYAKDQVRKVRGRVDDVEDKLDTVDGRLARLEADNDFLRQRLLDQPMVDATQVAEALYRIVQERAALSGGTRLLTDPVEVVQVLQPEPEVVPVAEPDPVRRGG